MEKGVYVIWHAEEDILSLIILIQSDSVIAGSCPILCNLIMLFEGIEEMSCMIFVRIYYPNIVYDKCKPKWSPFMLPKA
eukprot:11074167-Ditylum_brightwellii.AAC.1